MAQPKKTKPIRRRIPIAQLSFNEDPAEYEAQLRFNLSGKWHTKKTLVEYGVRAKIEQQQLQNEIAYYKARLSTEATALWTGVDLFIDGERDPEIVGKKIVDGRDGSPIELLLTLSKRAVKAKVGDTNAANAAVQRGSTPKSAAIKKFHSDWDKNNHGKERGWKRAAADHFGVSYSTIRRLAARFRL